MTGVDLSRAEWRKSSYSGQSGNCVQPDGWGRAGLGNAGPQRPGARDEVAGRRARLARVLRRRLDVGELAGCHAGTSPRSNHEPQGRLTLAASKGRSPMSPNAPRT
jgi:Domain of unknown function (DUF397)